MNVTELDTFVFKFKHLWKSGLDAHLDLECHAGQAWVGIRVRLGHEPGPHHHPHIPPQPRRTRDGPSRQRRRARRAAARQEHAEEAIEENEETNENEAEEAVYVEENEAAEVEINTKVTDEFCPDTDYSVDDLNEENSVTFRFVINDTAENESLVAFESLA